MLLLKHDLSQKHIARGNRNRYPYSNWELVSSFIADAVANENFLFQHKILKHKIRIKRVIAFFHNYAILERTLITKKCLEEIKWRKCWLFYFVSFYFLTCNDRINVLPWVYKFMHRDWRFLGLHHRLSKSLRRFKM
jgi:hypothetical protein